ncbi:MAG TPA: efflux RND transporter periplasmic adaptor subunit [Polyangiaceae bacterium]|nr:efflux RND transporter periplasmic adaptor subunit [Polyangiaceae bacterium]
MPRFIFHTLLILAGAAFVACSAPEPRAQNPEGRPTPVKLTVAHVEPFNASYRASGTVRGRTTAVLTSKAVGYVRSVAVRAGDRVRADQVLATLEANDSSASVRRANAGFEQSLEARAEAENAVSAAEAALRIAKSTHDRVAALHASGGIAQQEFDEAEARLQTATAQAEMARARLRMSGSRISQAKAEIGEAQAALDYSRIVAPFAGLVIERRIEPGILASPGMPLITLEQEGRVLVEVAVEESRSSTIKLRDPANVEIAVLDEPVVGHVAEIVPSVDVASRAFLVKIELPPEVHDLKAGMFARVSFRIGQKKTLVVPASAITRRGALEQLVVAEGDRLRLRMVTVGETQGSWIEVLSGLAAGERVVVSPGPATSDGARFTELP